MDSLRRVSRAVTIEVASEGKPRDELFNRLPPTHEFAGGVLGIGIDRLWNQHHRGLRPTRSREVTRSRNAAAVRQRDEYVGDDQNHWEGNGECPRPSTSRAIYGFVRAVSGGVHE